MSNFSKEQDDRHADIADTELLLGSLQAVKKYAPEAHRSFAKGKLLGEIVSPRSRKLSFAIIDDLQRKGQVDDPMMGAFIQRAVPGSTKHADLFKMQAQMLEVGLTRWAKTHPVAATEYLIQHAGEIEAAFGELAARSFELVLNGMLLEWAKRDLTAARKWVGDTMQNSTLRSGKFGEGLRGSTTGLTAATAALDPKQLRPGELETVGYRHREFVKLANGLLKTHDQKVTFARTVASVADEDERDRLLKEIGRSWAKEIPFTESSPQRRGGVFKANPSAPRHSSGPSSKSLAACD